MPRAVTIMKDRMGASPWCHPKTTPIAMATSSVVTITTFIFEGAQDTKEMEKAAIDAPREQELNNNPGVTIMLENGFMYELWEMDPHREYFLRFSSSNCVYVDIVFKVQGKSSERKARPINRS